MVSKPTMAYSPSSTSSATSSSTRTHTTISTHGVNPSLLLLFNMASMMTVKLEYNKYLVWRHQIEVVLEAYSMINFIEDNLEALDPFLKDSSGNYTIEANLEHIQWRSHEQALFTRETFCFSFSISHSQFKEWIDESQECFREYEHFLSTN